MVGVSVREQQLWHEAKAVQWDARASVLHLFVNVTADHQLTLQKAANRYQRLMIGSITHELRTPLNTSTNALELLEGEVTAAGAR